MDDLTRDILSKDKELARIHNMIDKVEDWNLLPEKPMLTICMATYNHEKFLRQALDGILMQQVNFRYEIIIKEDKSTDRTREIALEYQEKHPDIIRLWLCKENLYRKKLKPKIYLFARGKYNATCEGDDYWIDPLKLRKQVGFLEDNVDFVLCSHYINKVDANNNIIREVIPAESNQYFSQTEMFHRQHLRFPNLSLVHRNIDLIYDDVLLTAFNGDAVKVALLSSYGKAALLNFVGGVYRIHGGGVHSSGTYLQNVIKSIRTRKIMLNSSCFNTRQKKAIRKELIYRKRKGIKYALKHWNFIKAIKIYNV